MTVFELSLHRATGGVAPRADWAAPVVEMFDHCRLWEYWSEYLGVDSAVSYGGVGAAGSMVPYGAGDVSRLIAAVDAGTVSLMSAHRFAATSLSGPGGFVKMTYLFPYEPQDCVWMDAWGGLDFSAGDPELNRAGSMPGEWWAAAAELMVAAAVAFDAWYGSGIFHLQKDLMPHGRVYWQASFPRWGEGEVDWLPGLAPVFLLSPRMLEPMGGLDGLSVAPVHEVLPVEYRDGRTGAVVRVGADDDDLVDRLDAAYEFFVPFMRPVTGKGDVWPTGAARRAFE